MSGTTDGFAQEAERLAQALGRLDGMLAERAAREAALRREIDELRSALGAQADEIARLNARMHALLRQRNEVAQGLDGAIARIEQLARGAA
ncbi:MAG: hypothetical protein Kow00104_10850 [Rhodothalassiaceae bacterium]